MHQVGIEEVVSRELTAQDIRWLVIGAHSCKFFEITAEVLVKRAEQGEIHFYRVSGDADGMFAVSCSDSDFFIEAMAGKNFFRCKHEIHVQLKTIAQMLKKKRLLGWVARDGLAHFYDEIATATATLYVEIL